MTAHISAVSMEITVSDGKTVAQATELPSCALSKQEYNHGTGLEFP